MSLSRLIVLGPLYVALVGAVILAIFRSTVFSFWENLQSRRTSCTWEMSGALRRKDPHGNWSRPPLSSSGSVRMLNEGSEQVKRLSTVRPPLAPPPARPSRSMKVFWKAWEAYHLATPPHGRSHTARTQSNVKPIGYSESVPHFHTQKKEKKKKTVDLISNSIHASTLTPDHPFRACDGTPLSP